MASADQLKALLRSHLDGDDAHFLSVAMQVAASEARKGHEVVAQELRALVDEGKRQSRSITARPSAGRSSLRRGELPDLLEVDRPNIRLSDMSLTGGLEARLRRVVQEHQSIRALSDYGLPVRRRLLLIGPPGAGKTMTASALAGELALPLYSVRLDGLITKYMGETIAKLRLIFDAMKEARGVYLFDEFDSIGTDRGYGNDVGEIRRVLSAFLMYIEKDTSLSLIIAATNHPEHLDRALFRRFDDVVYYPLPSVELIAQAMGARLRMFDPESKVDLFAVAELAQGLSFSDVIRVADEAVKDLVLRGNTRLETEDLLSHVEERRTLQDGEF